ncbi:MAG: hypothetical protein A2939_00505 [Parcubacteria group bacterium RIFCSPLOWO2_01_FULL_48_18]|nr:MAG: hypothetical protein A3J67_05620 [Parcubacteria group bacterium RIFCSPHIGHO2_02_FULL_48_10b]OHB21963.1 MAG: hypothetical protein A2939_00505 [Parcubacteria group bacterium RIFCSPLOWO2_01_FULL_48_18]
MFHYLNSPAFARLVQVAERAKSYLQYTVANAVFAVALDEVLYSPSGVGVQLVWEVEKNDPSMHYDILRIEGMNKILCAPVPFLKLEIALYVLRHCAQQGTVENRGVHRRSFAQPYSGLLRELWQKLFAIFPAERVRKAVEKLYASSPTFSVEEIVEEIERMKLSPEERRARRGEEEALERSIREAHSRFGRALHENRMLTAVSARDGSLKSNEPHHGLLPRARAHQYLINLFSQRLLYMGSFENR